MSFNVCSTLLCDQGGFTEHYIGNTKKTSKPNKTISSHQIIKGRKKSAGTIWKSLVTSGSSVESATLITREPTAKNTEVRVPITGNMATENLFRQTLATE